MGKVVNNEEALKALKSGKRVKNGSTIFYAPGIFRDHIYDQHGFEYTSWFKLYANNLIFKILD